MKCMKWTLKSQRDLWDVHPNHWTIIFRVHVSSLLTCMSMSIMSYIIMNEKRRATKWMSSYLNHLSVLFPMPTVEGAELVRECYGFYPCNMSLRVAAEVESWWKMLKQIFNFFSIIPSCCECSISTRVSCSSHCDGLCQAPSWNF